MFLINAHLLRIPLFARSGYSVRVVNVGGTYSISCREKMSADTEGKKRIHFGSLEEAEKKRIKLQQQNGGEGIGLSAAVVAGIKAGNINIAEGKIQILLAVFS